MWVLSVEIAVRAHNRLDLHRNLSSGRDIAFEPVLDARLVQRDEHDDGRRVYGLVDNSSAPLTSNGWESVTETHDEWHEAPLYENCAPGPKRRCELLILHEDHGLLSPESLVGFEADAKLGAQDWEDAPDRLPVGPKTDRRLFPTRTRLGCPPLVSKRPRG